MSYEEIEKQIKAMEKSNRIKYEDLSYRLELLESKAIRSLAIKINTLKKNLTKLQNKLDSNEKL